MLSTSHTVVLVCSVRVGLWGACGYVGGCNCALPLLFVLSGALPLWMVVRSWGASVSGFLSVALCSSSLSGGLLTSLFAGVGVVFLVVGVVACFPLLFPGTVVFGVFFLVRMVCSFLCGFVLAVCSFPVFSLVVHKPVICRVLVMRGVVWPARNALFSDSLCCGICVVRGCSGLSVRELASVVSILVTYRNWDKDSEC